MIFLQKFGIILVEKKKRYVMYITLDLLQKRGACQEALDFFAKHYPNGIEMLEIITLATFLPISSIGDSSTWTRTRKRKRHIGRE